MHRHTSSHTQKKIHKNTKPEAVICMHNMYAKKLRGGGGGENAI